MKKESFVTAGRSGFMFFENRPFYDFADEMSAWRSFKSLVFLFITAALVFTVVFNTVYGIFPVSGVELNGEADVCVIVNRRAVNFNRGDTVTAKINNVCYCAEFLERSRTQDGIYIKQNGKSMFISDNDVEGRAECILFPWSAFGEDAHILCVE